MLMKTNRSNARLRNAYRITGATLTALLVLYSCQKEDIAKEEPMMTTRSAIDCNTNCIEIGGPYFEKADSRTVGSGPTLRTVNVIYYNTETDFVIKVKSTKQISDLYLDNVDVYSSGPVAANNWITYSFPLDLDWEACDNEAHVLRVIGQGGPVDVNISYDLIGLCDQGCETEFVGEAIQCGASREAVYEFTAEEAQDYIKIQGGLTNFTGADAVVTVTGGDLTVSQWTPGGSTNRVIKVEGSVEECEKVTIHITWGSTNGNAIITGAWSVKDENGIELAPYLDGLQCTSL